jgi:hypothetical protein
LSAPRTCSPTSQVTIYGWSTRAFNAQVHPLLLREDLELPSSGSAGWFLALAYADLHVKPYAKRHVKVYSDTRAPVAAAAG